MRGWGGASCIANIEYPQSFYSKELKELQGVIAPLRSAKELEDVCSLASLFHLFGINADIHIANIHLIIVIAGLRGE